MQLHSNPNLCINTTTNPAGCKVSLLTECTDRPSSLTAEVDWLSDYAVLHVGDLDLVDVISLDDERRARDEHTSQPNLPRCGRLVE